MIIYSSIGIIIILIFLYWKSRPVKNSHKIPQEVEIGELKSSSNEDDNNKTKELRKGHKLLLKRKLGGEDGVYHLLATVFTNGKDLSNVKKIIISWSEWSERIFNFSFDINDTNVITHKDSVTIDLGSFNNCPATKNFLKRTYLSSIIRFDMLEYLPEHDDFEWEKDTSTQSTFISEYSRTEIRKFKKGVHFIDS